MPLEFEALFQQLKDMGVYDYILPFLLVFAIIFAILEKIKLFGTENNKPRTNINVVISLIIGLLLVAQTPLVTIINNFLGKMAMFIIIVITFLLAIGIFGADVEQGFKGTTGMIAIIVAILAVIWALMPGFFTLPSWLTPRDTDFAAIILLVVIIVVIAIIVGGGKQESFAERIGREIFKKQ